MKRLGLACALVLAATAFAATADAGQPSGAMQATPDGATTDDDVTISNQAGDDNTCEGGFVNLFVENEDFETVFDDVVEPDGDGNWEQNLGQLPAGDYLAEADCANLVEELDGLQPQAQPFFAYADLEFTVTQVEPTTTSTEAPTTSASTQPAAEVRPTFTG